MELEEAIERLKRGIEDTMFSTLYSQEQEEEDIKTVLNHLTKQDKMIELLIKHICDVIDNDDGACLLPFYDSDENLEEKVKQYFENKVEEVQNK
jgi:hypothetical protein